jgi:hypothetical protein
LRAVSGTARFGIGLSASSADGNLPAVGDAALAALLPTEQPVGVRRAS